MKILKAVMLTLLISLCVAIAAVVVMHIFGGGDDTGGAQPRERVRGSADGEADMSIRVVLESGEDEIDVWEEFRFWPRATTRSQETGYLQFYPFIPHSILPGETVELSVSAVGFKGWEADPNQAQVEFFDEKTDEEMAFVSFIMPDNRVSIAALYENKVPSINYENQRETIMAIKDMHEYGAVPTPASEPWTPVQGPPIVLPAAVVGVPYPVRLNNPAGMQEIMNRQWWGGTLPDPLRPELGEGWLFDWRFEIPDALPWLDFDQTPGAVGGGGTFDGMPTLVSHVTAEPIPFRVRIYQYRPDQAPSTGVLWDTFWFAIRVHGAGTDPGITTTSFPAGTVGVTYRVPIGTVGFPEGSTWEWNIDDGFSLPAGLELRYDLTGDTRNAFIIGEPEDTPANLVSTGFPFRITASSTDIVNFPLLGDYRGPDLYNIRIWSRPTISEPTWPAPNAGVWHDGMVGHPYNHLTGANQETGAGGTISATNGIMRVTTPAGLPGLLPIPQPGDIPDIPPSWRWGQILTGGYGPLPEGLRLEVDPTDVTRAAITGTPLPATAGRSYPVSFSFVSTNPNQIIGEAEQIAFTIYIHPRPEFSPDETVIPDGMVGPGPTMQQPVPEVVSTNPSITWAISNEPAEQYAGATIAAKQESIPAGITGIVWHPDPLELPDSTLAFSNDVTRFLTITGTTTDNAKAGTHPLNIEFEIRHPNPNINGAREEKEHTIKIWNRAYLTVIIEPRERNSIAADVGRRNVLGDSEAFGRAIMPGEVGRIMAGQTASNFVRWEVSKLYNLPAPPGRPNETLIDINHIPGFSTALPPPGFFPAGPWTGIGNNWGLSEPGNDAFSWMDIRMPIPLDPEHPAINVEITGFHSGRPQITHTLPTGILGEDYPGRFRITNLNDVPSVIGGGPLPSRTFSIVEGSLPPGVFIDSVGGMYGEPTEIGTFIFRVGLTLPGTMRLELGPHSILIRRFSPTYGDVDGDGNLTLADLVLLSKFVNAVTEEERAPYREIMMQNNSIRNGNIMSTSGDPVSADLFALQTWFALEGVYDSFITSRLND